jgi:DNA repair protein RecN (Recombination protein N)
MIIDLTVENLAIIERVSLEMAPGFTVLTGETGAGKSLLIDAIELALGERGATELVRTGTAKASVSVVFDLSNSAEIRTKCDELGIELEDNRLYVQRDVALEGRSQCRVGGRPTPLTVLKELGQTLVDLHGQHDHQSLLDSRRHLSYLDAWIGEPVRILVGQLSVQVAEARKLRQELKDLEAAVATREQRLDMLQFQVGEIEAAGPVVGEYEVLEAELNRLKNSEKLGQAAFAALESLADGENSALDALGMAVQALEPVTRFDDSLESLLEGIRTALIQAEESAHELRAYAEHVEADPTRLEEVAERLDLLKRLRRKYGRDEAAILTHLESARRELETLQDSEAFETELRTQLAAAEAVCQATAEQLSSLRQSSAAVFASQVVAQLRDLAMERAQFEVSFGIGPILTNGQDLVEFQFSANAGESLRPLAKIASGGEISRVMLGLKTVLAGTAGVPTLIFDEVDSGVGGRTAAIMARKLAELGTHYQVLVISHSPQIAARADVHFRIEKVESAGRVATRVRPLSVDERVDEIARMLAGEQLTDSARANARELMAVR